MTRRLIVTGGAGFIGSAVVREILRSTADEVLVVDKLTYAGDLRTLAAVAQDRRYGFVQADIVSGHAMADVIGAYRPDLILHLAAETHVDRSIDGPGAFLEANVVGTFSMLQAALAYWRTLDAGEKDRFRFLHISTDEVFGSLGADGFFTEATPYDPKSPYAASKAASDHLARAWHHTYGLPVVISNCSNNYGPYQFPEKLVPLMILNALEGRELPVYGRGQNVRDWLYVEDHARALLTIAEQGRVGHSYNVGARNERTNLEVVRAICALVDELAPSPAGTRERLIRFVADRPGHDLRYAIDPSKIMNELDWRPRETFASALRKTVQWYLDNRDWWEPIRSGLYRGERLGVIA